jgi:hypothetical protein
MAGVSFNTAFDREVKGNLARGIKAVNLFLVAKIREARSKPAPRRKVKSRSGATYYVASTPATPGAPPRLVTARGRGAVTSSFDPATLTGRVGTNDRRDAHWERSGLHPFIRPTAEKFRGQAGELCRRAAGGGG